MLNPKHPDKVCKWFSVCPLKRFHEQGRIDEKWIREYCYGNYSTCKRKEMEEKGLHHADNMMPDGTIDKNLG